MNTAVSGPVGGLSINTRSIGRHPDMEEEDGCNQEKGRVNALKREEGGF